MDDTDSQKTDDTAATEDQPNLDDAVEKLNLVEPISRLLKILDLESGNTYVQTYGGQIAAFGQRRTAVADLLKDLVLLESDDLKYALAPLYGKLLELQTQFRQNSYIGTVLHSLFIYLFQSALPKGANGVGLTGLNTYRKQVIESSELAALLP